MKIKVLLLSLSLIMFGLNTNAQEVLVHSESFENPTTQWVTGSDNCPTYPWKISTANASNGIKSGMYEAYNASAGCNAVLTSPLISIANAGPDDSIYMYFDMYRSSDFSSTNDRIELYFLNGLAESVGPMPTPVLFRHNSKSPASTVGWLPLVYKVKLSNAGTVPGVSCRFEFKGISDYGQNIYIDNIRIYHVKKSAPSTLILTNPNGGNIITAQNSYNITWYMENINKVKIDFTIDGGLNWVNIATNINASNSTYNWIVPNTNSQTCKVRISDVDNPSKIDESDSYFTISSQTSVLSVENHSLFNVYPNPIKDKVFIDYTGQSSYLNFAFYSVQGKLIFSGSNKVIGDSNVIDIPNKITDGIYFIEISDGIETRRLKVVVSNN